MQQSAERSARHWPTLLLFVAAVGLLCLNVRAFWPWISDDAFIALRYSERFWDGKGLTWDDTNAVEGYSNFLWIVLCAAMRATGLDWVLIAQLLGFAATIETFVVLLRTPLLQSRGEVARGGALLLAATAPVGLWAIGGLEGPLTMLLVTVVFVRLGELLLDPRKDTTRRAAAIGGWLVPLVLCRSEGPLWVGCVAAALCCFGRQGPAGERHVLRRRLFLVIVPPALATLAHLAFRLAYYGAWVPNTAHAKLATSAATLQLGQMYVTSAAAILRGLWLPAAAGLLLACCVQRLRALALVCGASLVLWVSYVWLIGGDWYPLGRYLQSGYGICALLVGLLGIALSRWRFGWLLGWLVIGAGVVLARADARLDESDPYQRVSRWEWRGAAVGQWLGRAFGAQDPLLALDAAGAVPFFSRLRCLDMLGLCDSTIAKTPPPRPEHIIPAHSRGNPRYVLDQQPDLLLFGQPIGELMPRWPGGWQMEEQEPRLLSDYRCAMLCTEPLPIVGEPTPQPLEITLRVRTHGRLGVQRTAQGWRIPGWLLTTQPQTAPVLPHDEAHRPKDPSGLARTMQAGKALFDWQQAKAAVGVWDAQANAVVAELRQPTTLRLDGLALAAGDYRVEFAPTGTGLQPRLWQAGVACAELQGKVRVAEGMLAELVVEVRPTVALPLRLWAVQIVRAE